MNGTIIANKYQVIQEIARGAMGVVYLATHTTLGRQVAIKTLHPQYYTDPSFTKRFIREAQAMARLDHENIIRIFDILKTDDEFHIVMEYCAGLTLKDYMLKHKDLHVSKAMNIAYQVANGLAFAHSYEMVHRDIKPANIMYEESGRIKITDFGIVAGKESNLTVTGELVGTPHYMSPEQARGESVDNRSDLYSLGIVMMQMMTGTTPLNGNSILGIIGKLAYSHEEHEVSFPPSVSNELANIIRTLIKKNPDARFYNARSLSETLFYLMRQFNGAPARTGLYLSETDRLSRPNFLEDNRGSRDPLSHSSQQVVEVDDEARTQVIPLPPLSDLIDTKPRTNKKTWIGFLLLLLLVGAVGYVFYKKLYQPLLLPEVRPLDISALQANIPKEQVNNNDLKKIKWDVRRKRKEAINSSDNALIANAEVYAKTILVEARQFKKLAESMRSSASDYEKNQYHKESLTLYEQALFYFSQASQLFTEAEMLSVNNQRDKNIKKLIMMNERLTNEYNKIKQQIKNIENIENVLERGEKIYQRALQSATSAQQFLKNNAHDKAYRTYLETRKQLNQAIAVLNQSLATAKQENRNK